MSTADSLHGICCVETKLQFRRISKAMEAQAEVAAGTGHASTTGRIREEVVHRFLKPHLPRTLDVRSGVIIDSRGSCSKQQDCVIVDTRLPLIDIGSSTDALLIAESVVATIEIKSFLGAKEITDTLESIKVTRSLHRIGEQIYHKGPMECRLPKPNPILTYIFAYDGITLEAISNHIVTGVTDATFTPEAVCILKKGVLLRSPFMPTIKGSHAKLPAFKNVQMQGQELTKDALFAFYRRLIDDVMPLRMVNIDLDGYYPETELE